MESTPLLSQTRRIQHSFGSTTYYTRKWVLCLHRGLTVAYGENRPNQVAAPSPPSQSIPLAPPQKTITATNTSNSASLSTSVTTHHLIATKSSSKSSTVTSTMVFTSWIVITQSATPPTQKGSSGNGNAGSSRTNVGVIAGGTAGGGVFLAIAFVLFYFFCRQRKRRSKFLWRNRKDMGLPIFFCKRFFLPNVTNMRS